MFEKEIEFIRSCFPGKSKIPLHEPVLGEKEKEIMIRVIESGYVSSVGAFVDEFEEKLRAVTGVEYAVATVNGTSALHTALMVSGVGQGDEVLTQPLTFAATTNAIHYCGAIPVFIDIEQDTMGLSPDALRRFLESETIKRKGVVYNKKTGCRIAACLPVHIFGHPCQIDKIVKICNEFNIPVVEDSAEAMGTTYKNIHAGCFGNLGVLSFNGNKIITAGGGGAIITNDKEIAKIAKHLTTTARVNHNFEFYHDVVGYNYRMPNLNAALACAQLDQLPDFLSSKRNLSKKYERFFSESGMTFLKEPEHAVSNFWLICVMAESEKDRTSFIKELNNAQIMARPAWRLMNELEMYKHCQTDLLENAKNVVNRIVCLPSSVQQ